MAQQMQVPTSGGGLDSSVRMNRPAPAPSGQQVANEALRARLDPSSPSYAGPGYAAFPDATGALVLKMTNPQLQAEWQANQSRIQSTGQAQPTVPTLQDMQNAVNGPAAPAAPLSIAQRFAANPGVGNSGFVQMGGAPRPAIASVAQPASPFAQMGAFAPMPGAAAGAPLSTTPTSANPEAAGGPAEIDRSKIDALLGNVSKATSGVMGLANSHDQFSAAQAQLGLGLGAAQDQSLSIARSGNRRDAAANVGRALQANSEMAGEATRSSALLRAQEEDANKRLKLDAFKTAGDLGLNASALELDAERIDMTSATNYLNQLFETNRLNLQLDEAEAGRVTNFIRDMALIEKDYHALSLQEQAAIRDDLTRRYGISEQTKLGLEQLDRQGEVNWGQMGAQFLMGVGSGAASAGMTALVASDRRLKTDIADTTDDELEELLASVKSQTYTYRGERAAQGKQFGLMAQDLKRSRVGAGMVHETSDGTMLVDGGKAGMAALSGVSKVYDKLKQLEASL